MTLLMVDNGGEQEKGDVADNDADDADGFHASGGGRSDCWHFPLFGILFIAVASERWRFTCPQRQDGLW